MNEREIFSEALQKPTDSERSAFLEQACRGNPEVRRRIELLIEQQADLGSFMEHPPMEERFRDLRTQRANPADLQNTLNADDPISLGFLDPSNQPDSLGRLGKYEISEVIGRGGMGIVLKGIDTELNRVAAVKVLAPELPANATARKRFRRESQAAAAISHDHVVTIFAVEDSEPPYLVMEYIDGQSLQQKIDAQGTLEVKEILRISRQIALGLAAAHEQGLIHRDIKPSNILLQNGIERTKITDFGLARTVDDVDITRSGQITGSPQYMSPEQAAGLTVDARSDLFSFGCVLYAMCTGRSPFRADTTIATIRRVCDETPRSIRDVNPEIPEWLVDIIERLLAKSPTDRFQSAPEVAELLSQHLAHLQDPNSTPVPEKLPTRSGERKRRHRWLVAAATLLILGLGLGFTEATGFTHVAEYAATVLRISTPNGFLVLEIDDPAIKVAVEGNGEKLTISRAGIKGLELKPGDYQIRATKDGQPFREELVTITRGGRKVLSLTRESLEALPLPVARRDAIEELRQFKGHTGPVKQIDISPDGNLGISGSGYPQGDWSVRIWEIETGNEIRRLPTSGTQIMTVCFSPDGQLAAASGFGGLIHIWEVATGRKINTLQTKTEVVDDLEFSPDGRQLLCATHKRTYRNKGYWGEAQLWDVETELRIWEYKSQGWLTTGAFLPGGQRVIVAGRKTGNHIQFLDRKTGDELSELRFADPPNDQIEELGISSDGRYIVSVSELGYILLWEVDGGDKPVKYRGNMGNLRSVAFSHDSSRLFCGGGEGEFGRLQLLKVPSLEIVASVENPAGLVWHVAYHPDGHHALSAGGYAEDRSKGDYALRLWRLPELLSPTKSAHESVQDQIKELSDRIANSPAETEALIERAHLHTRMRRWREAADDLEATGSEVLRKPGDAFLYAVLLTHLGKEAAHQELCNKMVDKFADTSDVWTANCLVKSCLLRPGVVDSTRLPVKLLSEDYEFATDEPPWVLREARALIAYRMGQFNDCREHVRQTMAIPAYNDDPLYAPRALSLLSMANRRIGNTQLAHDLYEEAVKNFKQVDMPIGHAGSVGWLYADLYLREAALELGR